MTDAERCHATALRILNVRFNSEAELRRKLRAKEFDDAVVDATIQRLREEKWLDDARFAGAFVRTRARKRIGKLRIRRELAAAGVAEEEAASAIAENVDADAERDSLIALCRKKTGIIARRHGSAFLQTDEGRKKVVAYLLNQGYELGEVLAVLKEIKT